METVCAQYQSRGLMRLKKVDPPVKVLGGGAARKVIFLENPWTDYAGCWSEAGGRAVFAECKSTQEPRLTIQHSGGLTTNQLENLLLWEAAGAFCFVLWECREAVYYISMQAIRKKIMSGVRHFKPIDVAHVQQGQGFILFDFLENMRCERALAASIISETISCNGE